MGINSSSRCREQHYPPPPNINPNPERFEIKDTAIVGKFFILKVNYPDATNFEGDKILVFDKGYTNHWEILGRTKGKLDPHFSAGEVSPVARFKPTPEGWELALRFAQYMVQYGS